MLTGGYEPLQVRHYELTRLREMFIVTFVELAGLPAPPTFHTIHLYPFHLSLPFPLPDYTAGDLEILPGLS